MFGLESLGDLPHLEQLAIAKLLRSARGGVITLKRSGLLCGFYGLSLDIETIILCPKEF